MTFFSFFAEYRKAFSRKFLLFFLLLCCRQIRGQQILQLYYNVPFVFGNVRKSQILCIFIVLSKESKFLGQITISNFFFMRNTMFVRGFFKYFPSKHFQVFITVTSIEVKHWIKCSSSMMNNVVSVLFILLFYHHFEVKISCKNKLCVYGSGWCNFIFW